MYKGIAKCQTNISCICAQIIVSNSFVSSSEPCFVFCVLADVGKSVFRSRHKSRINLLKKIFSKTPGESPDYHYHLRRAESSVAENCLKIDFSPAKLSKLLNERGVWLLMFFPFYGLCSSVSLWDDINAEWSLCYFLCIVISCLHQERA